MANRFGNRIAKGEDWELYDDPAKSNGDWRSMKVLSHAKKRTYRYSLGWNGRRFADSMELKRLRVNIPKTAKAVEAAVVDWQSEKEAEQ